MEFNPKVGFGNMRLGDDRDTLVAHIGGHSKRVRNRIMCFGAGAFLDADDAGRVEFIEFFDQDVPLSFRDLNLWDTRTVPALIDQGFAASFDPGESGITFYELGLAYYLEDGRIASVSAFPDGYYDRLGASEQTLVHTTDGLPGWLTTAIQRDHG